MARRDDDCETDEDGLGVLALLTVRCGTGGGTVLGTAVLGVVLGAPVPLLVLTMLADRCPSSGTVQEATCVHLHGLTSRARLQIANDALDGGGGVQERYEKVGECMACNHVQPILVFRVNQDPQFCTNFAAMLWTCTFRKNDYVWWCKKVVDFA